MKFFRWEPLDVYGRPQRTITILDQYLKKKGFQYRVENDNIHFQYRVENDNIHPWTDIDDQIDNWMEENLQEQWSMIFNMPGSNLNMTNYYYFQNKDDMLKFVLVYGAENIEAI